MKRCLCVFSRILGWRIFGDYVDRGLERHASEVSFDYLDYDAGTSRLSVPWYRRFSDTMATTCRLERLMKSRAIDLSQYEALIFQGHDLAIPFRASSRRPAGIIADTTPAIAARRERGRRGIRSLAKRIWSALQHRFVFRPIFRHMRSFLVLSETVKRSLIADYGIPEARVFVIGPPVYERVAAAGSPQRGTRPVLLFVGNDFERKGGPFLLDLYEREFAEVADLWVVSSHADASRIEPIARLFSNLPQPEVLKLTKFRSLFACHPGAISRGSTVEYATRFVAVGDQSAK